MRDLASGLSAIAVGSTRVVAPAVGVIGVALVVIAVATRRIEVFAAALALLVGLIGLLLRNRSQLTREDENYRLLFDSSPVATLEEDFTAVEEWLQGLRADGVEDLRAYLSRNPQEVRNGIALIAIRRSNPAAAKMIEAGSTADLTDSFGAKARHEGELESFIEQFVAIWEGRRELALDLQGLTFEGHPLEAVLHWSVSVRSGASDLSRVMVTISDITPRKVIEERLARALESNRQLLAFEQALATCSRALLLGSGDDALRIALQTLRNAIGADRAYLAINVDDPDLGPSFRVVESASKPEFELENGVGTVVPWSEYPMALEPLTRGEPFRHLASGEIEPWNRSLLAVPVESGGRWLGTVGFVDIAQRTHWRDEAVKMLGVAAPMLGTFWERETTRQQLEELVRSKDRFVASVSHELRTPLAAILGFAEELKNHASTFEPHELSEILELIADQSQDMTDMVEDLLVSARADIGTISFHSQDVYLRSLAEAALAGIGSADLSTIIVVGGPGKAWADPTRTRQIIRNLLTNAVRYGGGKVEVEARSEGPTTYLAVRDDGPGLSRSEWERIFEPYQRAHDRPTQTASIGLGLTVSRQLARLMGGDVTYRADDSGSIFELTLPSSPPPGGETSEVEDRHTTPTPGGTSV